MADGNKPRGREKNVTGQSGSVNRRGEGIGGGPVGNAGGYSGRPGMNGSSSGGSQARAAGVSSLLGNKKIIIAIVIIVALFFIFGGWKLLGNIDISDISSYSATLSSFTSSSVSSGWSRTANTGKLNTSVADGARDKYTTVKADGTDKVTIMVYMCGTDLESNNGMASADLSEMANATLSDSVNVIVYTGGCTAWKTKSISNSANQIWKVEKGGIKCLESDMGNKAMTKPDTLSEFIKWCGTNYPANRNVLIFWDHGGGSISGYGYDQRFEDSGSMSLTGINTALKNGGMKFDFIGFDACLMATAENAIMLTQYADYLVASEETEPGVGWYYTEWLTSLSANPGMSTLEVGKTIADSFTDYCAQKLSSSKTTLSVVDLAELEKTLPDSLKQFAEDTSKLINSDSYDKVSDARSGTREFATSSKIDQVDLVDLAGRMGTDDGEALAQCILSAVKYNRTSASMTNSYGLSIYFPYRKASYVNTACTTYDAIGMDSEYAECIRLFAGYEVSGQVASGGTSSPLGSLLGSLVSSGTSSDTSSSAISALLSSFIGGSSDISISGLTGSAASFLSELDLGKVSNYISKNSLSASDFVFKATTEGSVIALDDEKWALVQDIELNVFADDGSGYIDMGLDNTFSYTDSGALLAEYDGTWIAVNGQPVAYYHLNTVDDGTNYTITGRIPVFYNGSRADLTVIYSNEYPHGRITGITYDYASGVTETVAKSIDIGDVADGDTIDFLADYYSYSGEYQDSYMIGEQLVYSKSTGISLSDVYITGKTSATYRFTDIYGQHYWSSVMD